MTPPTALAASPAASPAPAVEVRLLDHLMVQVEGVEARLTSRKAVALLVYLALQRDRSARRDVLANLLWENVDTAQGRVNLRQAIATLRRLERPDRPVVEADLDTVRLTGAIAFDTDRFDRLAHDDPSAAMALYRADPLAGFVLRDAPAFNEWLNIVQAHWRSRAVGLLTRLLDRADKGHDLNGAIAAGLQLLAIDPYNEFAHRALMRIYTRQGRSALALAQYRGLADLLRREMGVTPEAETQRLYGELQAFRRHRDSEPVAPPAPVQATPASPTPVAAPPAAPRIAVVDDEGGVRDAVGAYLRLQGYAVVECADGAALDQALAHGRFDLFILDVTMPGEDGFSIARRLNRVGQVPTIMLTARTDLVDRVVGLELGADDYIGKPFELRELLARVRAVLRRAGTADPV